MIMHPPTVNRLSTRLLLALVACHAATAVAQPAAMPFNPQQAIEQWGQVLYCQKAYAHPDNVSRVYEYDIQQCAAAERYVLGQLAVFPDSVTAEMKALAQKRAGRIMANTRDITQVLGSCRQACSQMAERAPEPPAEADPATDTDDPS